MDLTAGICAALADVTDSERRWSGRKEALLGDAFTKFIKQHQRDNDHQSTFRVIDSSLIAWEWLGLSYTDHSHRLTAF